MSPLHCPGQDQRYWKPDDIFDVDCPWCGTEVEFWKDEPVRTCPVCRKGIPNPRMDMGCAAWCLRGKECLQNLRRFESKDEDTWMNQMEAAARDAIQMARVRLKNHLLDQAAAHGSLIVDKPFIHLSFLGIPHRLDMNNLEVSREDQQKIHIIDEMLILRYLECELTIKPIGEWITFRDLPGGSAYSGPVAKRTTDLLIQRFANDLDGLRTAARKFPHIPLEQGDLGFQFQAIGKIDVALIYHQGDEEFPPNANLLYDRIITHVYHTDEVAALATRLCVGLVR